MITDKYNESGRREAEQSRCGLVITNSATPSTVRQSISAGNGKRGGMGVRQPPAEGVAEAAAVVPAEDPEPMKTTKTSSMAVASGNSCLLWSTLVMAAAVGLPMAARPPRRGDDGRALVHGPTTAGAFLPGGCSVGRVPLPGGREPGRASGCRWLLRWPRVPA